MTDNKHAPEGSATTEQLAALKFPWDDQTKKFLRDFYVPMFTDYRISFQQIDEFLVEVDKLTTQRIKRVKNLYRIFLAIAFVVSSAFLLSILLVDDHHAVKGVLGFFWFLISIICCALLAKFIRRVFAKIGNDVAVLSNNYSSVFEAQGFKWIFAMSYPVWIELVKEDRIHQIIYPDFSDVPSATKTPAVEAVELNLDRQSD